MSLTGILCMDIGVAVSSVDLHMSKRDNGLSKLQIGHSFVHSGHTCVQPGPAFVHAWHSGTIADRDAAASEGGEVGLTCLQFGVNYVLVWERQQSLRLGHYQLLGQSSGHFADKVLYSFSSFPMVIVEKVVFSLFIVRSYYVWM